MAKSIDFLSAKTDELEQHLRNLGPCVVAFSGGVDSTFLAAMVQRAFGPKALAVTIDMPAIPARKLAASRRLAAELGIRQRVERVDQLAVEGFCENSERRCYYCKQAIIGAIAAVAGAENLGTIVEGSNVDDQMDVRPGQDALRENGVLSPLLDLDWTKEDIRDASRRLGLRTADLPSDACLASRIPYGEPITARKMEQVDLVELWLHNHGVSICRARHHGDVVRVELGQHDMHHMGNADFREGLAASGRRAGFRYVAIDVSPYRLGNLNPER